MKAEELIYTTALPATAAAALLAPETGLRGPAVSLSQSLGSGLVRQGTRLHSVLSAIEGGFARANPRSEEAALTVVQAVVQSLGMEIGQLNRGNGFVWARQSGGVLIVPSRRVMAFNEVISLVQQTALGLGIPLSELGLADIDPDRDLV